MFRRRDTIAATMPCPHIATLRAKPQVFHLREAAWAYHILLPLLAFILRVQFNVSSHPAMHISKTNARGSTTAGTQSGNSNDFFSSVKMSNTFFIIVFFMLLIIRVSKKKNSCLPHGCQESMEIITKKIKKPIGNSCLPHGCQEIVSKKVKPPKNNSCLLLSCHEPCFA